MHPNPLAYGIPAGLGALILAVFGPFVAGAIVLSTILSAMLLIFLADVVTDIVASLMLPGLLNSNFGQNLSADSVDVLPFLFSDADLDDLVYRGELPVIEQSSINFQSFTPSTLQTFRLNFDAARFGLPALAEGATTPLRDAFTGVSAAESDLICEGRTVTPSAGVSVHDFGLMPV